MIIPIGHEHTTVRRLPWVTFVLMGLCLVVFLLTFSSDRKFQEEAFNGLDDALDYFLEHPYLELPPRFEQLLVSQFGEEETRTQINLIRDMGGEPPASDRILQAEQEQLNDLVDDAFVAMAESPIRKWGLVAADFHLPTIITYQFLHAGWMHLFGNLFLLFLAGPFIEDVWGRPLFTSFYLVAGAFAGLMFMVRYPELNGPLIGASGSIAGVMGAFLIRYWNTKIKFFYWFSLIFTGTFTAPAWLMLPLWFFKELAFASLADYVAPGSGGGNVAFWAHVWGFAFGVAVAYLIARLEVEEKYIHSNIESKITVIDNTAVEDALAMADRGDTDGAVSALGLELKEHPGNVDAAVALWSLGVRTGTLSAAVPHMMRAIRNALRRGDEDFIMNHWEDLLHSGEELDVGPVVGVRLAEILANRRQDESASETLALARREVNSSAPAALLLRIARLGVVLQSPDVDSMIDAAVAHPETPPEARAELESARSHPGETGTATEAEDGHSETVGDDVVEAEINVVTHTIQTMSAIPRKLEGENIQLEVNGELRKLALNTIQAVAAVGIVRAGQKPVVLVDLLLDSPWDNRKNIRAVRLMSNSFDPRPLTGVEDPLPAFQKFLVHVLDVSEAVPLPDPDSARGQPFRSYPSIKAYEQEVLNAEG
jgi:membrane associated rhomboid family serine protease